MANSLNQESGYSSLFNKPFFIMADVAGIGLIEAFVDTGSYDCWIRKECLTNETLSKMIPSSEKREGFDGSTENVLGDLFLDITLLGRKVQVRVHVMNRVVSANLCLGVNWMCKMGIVIRPDGDNYYLTLKGGKRDRENPLAYSLPIFPMIVDGIGDNIYTLVDTASPLSIISAEILTEQMISTIFKSPRTLRSTNGKDTISLGCVSLDVTYLGATTKVNEVYVVPNSNYPLILGKDWIGQTGVTIMSDGSEIVVSRPMTKRKSANAVAAKSSIRRKSAMVWWSSFSMLFKR